LTRKIGMWRSGWDGGLGFGTLGIVEEIFIGLGMGEGLLGNFLPIQS